MTLAQEKGASSWFTALQDYRYLHRTSARRSAISDGARATMVRSKTVTYQQYMLTYQQYMLYTTRMAFFHRLLFIALCCSVVLEVCCITVEEFYSFGESSGDSLLTRVLDGSSGPITLRTEFPFFNQSYKIVYVSKSLHVYTVFSYLTDILHLAAVGGQRILFKLESLHFRLGEPILAHMRFKWCPRPVDLFHILE